MPSTAIDAAYSGIGDSACTEPYEAETAWTTRGTQVFGIVIADQGVLAVVAQRTRATSAAVQTVAFGPDFQELFPTSGTLTLPSPRTAQFSIQGLISECGTLVHNGDFIGQANTAAAASASQPPDLLGLGSSRSQRPPRAAIADAGDRQLLRALRAAIR